MIIFSYKLYTNSIKHSTFKFWKRFCQHFHHRELRILCRTVILHNYNELCQTQLRVEEFLGQETNITFKISIVLTWLIPTWLLILSLTWSHFASLTKYSNP
jgi:hypothetical protein